MPENKEASKQNSKEEKKEMTNKKILAFSLEFGFMIALPLLLFTFLGKYLASHHHNQGFLYGGIVLALITSFAWFWKRISDIYKDYLN